MQRFGIKSAVLACGVVGLLGQSASAVVLYTANGFEPGVNTFVPVTGHAQGTFLDGNSVPVNPLQPNGPRLGWQAGSTGTPLQTAPYAAVYGYTTPTGTNTQYVQLAASSYAVTQSTSYFNNTTLPFNGALSNDDVAVTFSMNRVSGTNNPFFGVIATDSAGNPIGQIGINGSTGALVGGTSAFVAAANTFYNYQLLLDFNSQSYKTFVDTGAGFVQQGAAVPFLTAATTFATADLSIYNLGGTGTYSGVAQVDDLLVQTVVPEPATLGLVAVGGLLLGRRRARNRA